MSCFICDHGRLISSRCARVLSDHFPVTPGHMLVCPARHVSDLRELTDKEWELLWLYALGEARKVDGPVNIGVNIGRAAGQTVEHAHVHVIPRREGDVEDPRGGVRGVIPWRRVYGEGS